MGLDPEAEDNFINGMGIMFVLLIGIVLVAIAIAIGAYLFSTNYKMYSKFRQLKEKIYYNAFLRY